jgi:fermentation-respiration switch protein FrsA (DUF1100 family)
VSESSGGAQEPTASDAERDRRVFRAARTAVILIVAIVVLDWVLHLFLFHPSRHEAPEVARIGERVTYPARDGTRLSSWWVPSRTPARRTLVYFHGNAATASDLWGWAAILAAHDTDVLLAEYRGYGESEGAPTAHGIEHDAVGAIDYLVRERHVPLDRLVVHGQSLGGAAAITALAGPAQGAAGGVIESTFTSLHDMASAVIGLPLSRVVPDAYALDSYARAADVRAPILHVHGDADEVIPFPLGERLRDRLRPRRFVRVPGGHHNLDDPHVTEEVLAFLDEVTR